jgi:hypothetical protein
VQLCSQLAPPSCASRLCGCNSAHHHVNSKSMSSCAACAGMVSASRLHRRFWTSLRNATTTQTRGARSEHARTAADSRNNVVCDPAATHTQTRHRLRDALGKELACGAAHQCRTSGRIARVDFGELLRPRGPCTQGWTHREQVLGFVHKTRPMPLLPHEVPQPQNLRAVLSCGDWQDSVPSHGLFVQVRK